MVTIASDQASDQAKVILNAHVHSRVKEVLIEVAQWIKRADVFVKLNLSSQSTNRKKYLDPLIEFGWIEMEYPDKKTSPVQRYKTTDAGKRILKLISRK